MAYSLDFRKRVLSHQDKNRLTQTATANLFDLSVRTLYRWGQRIEPKTTRNKPAIKIDMESLKSYVEEFPDKYQYEIAVHFKVSTSCIQGALKRLIPNHF